MWRLFSAIFLLFGLQRINASHWRYPDRDLDEDFPHWGGICETGTRQSPIDLNTHKAIKGVFGNLILENFDQKQKGVTLVNNGHTIRLSNFSSVMVLGGGPLLDEYVIEQLHLHWWSEHTVNNVRYPLEVHIVSRNKRYDNVSMAINYKDGITVLGILYHVSNKRNEAIQQIIDHMEDVKSHKKINQPVYMKEAFVVRHLVPRVKGYVTYSGSLTTPNCAEAVTWIVMTETYPVTLAQVESFKGIQNEEHKALKSNYRDIQKTNNRPLIVVQEDDDEASHAVRPMQISLAAVLFMLFVPKLM